MGRAILLVLVLIVLALFLSFVVTTLVKKRVVQTRQKHLAQYAPWALRHEVSPQLAEFIIEQGRTLDEAEVVLRQLVNDEATLLTTADADKINRVLKRIAQDKTRR